MSVLKWLQSITRGLFATSERPVFLIIDENATDETSVICSALSVLGGDVVSLRNKENVSHKDYLLYDGIINVLKKSRKIQVVCRTVYGQKLKTFKKSFFEQEFAI